ncbi:MAG: hypothetical protein ACRDTH_13825 [Pseudonocardiaceae bacterium]
MTAPRPEGLLALLVELDRVRAVILDLLERTAPPLLPVPPQDTDGDSRRLYELLVSVRRAVLGHPAAAKTLHDLLIAEGRRYAETAAGAQLREALVTSEAVAHLRRIWETVSLNVLDGPAAPSGVPDAWAEALSDAITGKVLDDTVLARLRPDGFT